MRWKTKPQVKHLDIRERVVFALSPREANDGHTYWLRYLYVKEMFEEYYFGAGWKRLCVLPWDHPDVPARWRLDPSSFAEYTYINGERI